MKLLIVLTYYRPYVSGLTIYAERLARGMAVRGHEVTVLTSRYDRSTPLDETVHGVRIVRVPVAVRVSKGVIMPRFGLTATRLVREHDVLSLHLPQFDAAGVAIRGRLMRRATTLTYHCDLSLPPGLFNRFVNGVTNTMNLIAGKMAHRVVAYTEDFARHSPYLTRFANKVTIIPPPVEVAEASEAAKAELRARHRIDGAGPIIGMAARLATEKGVEVLLRALPRIRQEYPAARVLFAGQHEDVLGEEAYARRLQPLMESLGDRWSFLGILDADAMAAFYSQLDVIVVPSLNSTESFGLVQVEAMLCGAPSVASNLPGVRQPVTQTGMGEVTPIGDGDALADAILRIARHPERYHKPREAIAAHYGTAATLDGYERLFDELQTGSLDRRRPDA